MLSVSRLYSVDDRMIMKIMNVEQLVEWELTVETEVLGEKTHQLHLSTTNATCPDLGSNKGCRDGKLVTNPVKYVDHIRFI
jgi:hypothetical protein